MFSGWRWSTATGSICEATEKKNSAALGDDVTCVSLRKQKICVALG